MHAYGCCPTRLTRTLYMTAANLVPVDELLLLFSPVESLLVAFLLEAERHRPIAARLKQTGTVDHNLPRSSCACRPLIARDPWNITRNGDQSSSYVIHMKATGVSSNLLRRIVPVTNTKLSMVTPKLTD